MKYIFAILGFFFAFGLIKFRESIGNALGEQPWMRYVGGIYNLIVLIAVFIFFWSLATLTGTEDVILYPFIYILPGSHNMYAEPTALPEAF